MPNADKILTVKTRIDGTNAVRVVLLTKEPDDKDDWNIKLEAKGIATVTLGKENALISGVFVAANHRRKGVAGRLIAECARIARRAKLASVSLIVIEKNRSARRAYKKLGFHCVYHFNNGDDLLSMRL